MAKTSSPQDIVNALAGVGLTNDEEATPTKFLDTGFPVLNHASNADWAGGFPVGRVIEIAGPPSAGKTAIATRAMAAAQKMGGIAGFMDHERSFSIKLSPKLGLDNSPGRFIYKKPETFEASIATFHLAVSTIRDKKLIDPKAPICWVFDSLAAMTPYSVIYDDKGKRRDPNSINMRDKLALATATSVHFPGVTQVAEDYGVCCIFLNQMRTNIGVMFGDNRKTTGGNAPEFYFSQRMWLSSKKIKVGTDVIGMEVTGQFVKNKVARPYGEAKWRFMFEKDGTGRFDRERSLIDFLEAEGHLTKGRPGYIEWDGKQYSRDQLTDLIRDEGDAGFDKLKALLPASYTPPVVAQISIEDDTVS